MDDGFGSETMPIFAIAEELGKLNEENFESRRRELSQLGGESAERHLGDDADGAWCWGLSLPAASVFRISSLEKESAAHQKAS